MKLTHNQACALTEVADRNGFPVEEKKSRGIRWALRFLIHKKLVEKASVNGKKYYALTNAGFIAYFKFCKYGLEFPDEIKLHGENRN